MAEGDEIVGNEPGTVRLANADRVGDQCPKRRDSFRHLLQAVEYARNAQRGCNGLYRTLPDPKDDDRDKLPSDGEQVLNVDQHEPGERSAPLRAPAVLFLSDQHAQDVARLRRQ